MVFKHSPTKKSLLKNHKNIKLLHPHAYFTFDILFRNLQISLKLKVKTVNSFKLFLKIESFYVKTHIEMS